MKSTDTKDDVVVCEYPPATIQAVAAENNITGDVSLRERVRLVAWGEGIDLTIDEMIVHPEAERGSGYNEWEPAEHAIHFPHGTIGDLALALLPHLTGDELRRVAEAMPRVAGEWVERSGRLVERYERIAAHGNAAACVRHARNDDGWSAETTDPYERTWHPTARAAQAACDARLEAAGVRLCGEVVRDG